MTLNGIHSVISHKVELITTGVRTSNATNIFFLYNTKAYNCSISDHILKLSDTNLDFKHIYLLWVLVLSHHLPPGASPVSSKPARNHFQVNDSSQLKFLKWHGLIVKDTFQVATSYKHKKIRINLNAFIISHNNYINKKRHSFCVTSSLTLKLRREQIRHCSFGILP